MSAAPPAPVESRVPPAAPEPADFEQFQIYSRIEIVALLREMQVQHTLVTVYFDAGERFVLTNVLAVNPEFEELVLDVGPREKDTAELLRSPSLVVVTFLHHVKIQFHAAHAEHTTHEGRDALRIRLPDSVLRFQRRDTYRVQTPLTQPLVVKAPAGDGRPKLDLKVFDLSCGGVGVQLPLDAPPVEPGLRLGRCTIDLPGVGTVATELEVRHVMRSTSPAGPITRCGLQFVALPPGQATLVQRYINKLDRERRMHT